MARPFFAAALLASTIVFTACNPAAETSAATETAASIIAVSEPPAGAMAPGMEHGEGEHGTHG